MINTVTKEQLIFRQNMPLDLKEAYSIRRIKQWYEYWNGQVYVAFSGGKDSTVLLHLVRSVYPDVKGCFINTGLEYPEVVDFVKDTPNIDWIRPKMGFKEVIEKYGYPVISKEQSNHLHSWRVTKSEKTKNLLLNGNKWGLGKISNKWLFLRDAPFKISDVCCLKLKKSPAKQYEKETGLHPFIGLLTGDSQIRRQNYLKFGCNAFSKERPSSIPLAFWREEDIYEYINKYNLKISKIYSMGYKNTGCMFCMFGVHREQSPNRFQKMKINHPELYDYCINKLGCGLVMDYIGINYK